MYFHGDWLTVFLSSTSTKQNKNISHNKHKPIAICITQKKKYLS